MLPDEDAMTPVPIEKAREMFTYNPETGALTRRVGGLGGPRGLLKAGDHVGWMSNGGYLAVNIGRVKLRLHRVVWAMAHGRQPDGDIDHINGDRTDNRLCNLRVVSRTVNKQNTRRAHSNSTTGLLGASPYRGKFRARIVVHGREKQIGLFPTPEAAHAAYIAAKRQLHEGCTL